MHFCIKCQNMYYTRLGGEHNNQLIYYCRKCGHEDKTLSSDVKNICVSKTHIRGSKSSFKHMVNEYTKLDPTLPRINNIPCPNPSCPSHQEDEPKENDVIYERFDDANLKYVYICNNCDTVWENSTN